MGKVLYTGVIFFPSSCLDLLYFFGWSLNTFLLPCSSLSLVCVSRGRNWNSLADTSAFNSGLLDRFHFRRRNFLLFFFSAVVRISTPSQKIKLELCALLTLLSSDGICVGDGETNEALEVWLYGIYPNKIRS